MSILIGVFEVAQVNDVTEIYFRPTLYAVLTKCGNFNTFIYGGPHPRTLLQGGSRCRSPEALSQLDDQSGRGLAVDLWSMRVRISGNGDIKSGERQVSQTCRMAKQRYDKGKTLILYYSFVLPDTN